MLPFHVFSQCVFGFMGSGTHLTCIDCHQGPIFISMVRFYYSKVIETPSDTTSLWLEGVQRIEALAEIL